MDFKNQLIGNTENKYNEIYSIRKEITESIKIDEVRNLFEGIEEKPIFSKNKIYEIFHAENLNINSQNAILKILEEPPKYAIIMLYAKSIDEILPTIKSRCNKIYIHDKNKNSETKREYEDYGISQIYTDAQRMTKVAFYLKYKEKITKDNYKQVIYILEEMLQEQLETIVLKKPKTEIHKLFIDINRKIKRNCNFEILITKYLLTMWDELN